MADHRATINTVFSLADLLPLAIPDMVHIDPCNQCNFACRFCPTGHAGLLTHVQRPQGMMEMPLFRKIVSELADMEYASGQKIRKLHLYKDGEPLLHKKLVDMVAFAKQCHLSQSVETTTNGSCLTPHTSQALVEAGLDVMRVSIEAVSDEKYHALTRTHGSYQRIVDNVATLHEICQNHSGKTHLHVKICDTGLSTDEKARFVADFEGISDSLGVDSIMGWSRTDLEDFKLGIKPGLDRTGMHPRMDRQVCPEAFSKLAINVDGSVSVCCVDWTHETVIGNATHQNLKEIWDGETLRTFRRLHLTGQRGGKICCRHCDYIQSFAPYANLDDAALRLLLNPAYR